MHEQHYFDLNKKPAPIVWPWAVATIVCYAFIGVLLAWRG